MGIWKSNIRKFALCKHILYTGKEVMRMGAIAGVIDMRVNDNTEKQMLMTMKRRGPFESPSWCRHLGL